MDKTPKMYLKSFRGLLAQKDWYPTWITNMTQIKLGDVGTLDENYFFETKTSLKKLGINFNKQRSRGDSDFMFKTEGGVDFEVKAAGEALDAAKHIPLANAGIVFDFKKKGALYVHAARYSSTTIPDINDLETGIKQLMTDGKWKNDWCIVTQVNEAPLFAFLICTQSKGVIEVSADTPIGQNVSIALGDVNIKFSVRFGNSSIFEQLSNKNAVMAYQIYRVKRPKHLPISVSSTILTPPSVTRKGRSGSTTPSFEIEHGIRQSKSREPLMTGRETSNFDIASGQFARNLASPLLEIVRD